MFKKNSLRFKFLLLIFVLIILIAIFHTINIIYDYNYQVKSELDSFESLAESISLDFLNYIEDIWMIEEITGNYINRTPGLSISEANAAFKYIQFKQEGINSILWLDPEGKVLASSDEELVHMVLSESYVKEINNGKNKVISDLSKNITSPYQFVLPIARAIKKGDKLMGIMAVYIDSDELGVRLPDIKISKNTSFLLVDKKGMIVYCSDIKKTPADRGSMIIDDAVVQALKGTMVTCVKERYIMDDTIRMSVNYPINKIGWYLKVSSPYGFVMRSHFKQLNKKLIFLIFGLILSIIICMFWVDKFLKPVLAVKSAAKQIMDGDYSARTHINSQDEIGLTAEAFDKMAESIERLSSSKTQFFTNVSHELKMPINVIFASIQLMESYKLNKDLEFGAYRDKITKQMKLIRQNCYRIMRLISNLIDISRHDCGFLNVKLNNFDIVKLVREITLSVERYVEAKDIKLTFTSELESKWMACDPDMIERILLNLISNAVKFTDKNGMITVSVKGNQDNIILTVKDTGIGIPSDKLKCIFERFRQVDDTFRRNQEGSGIGLHLVKAFVDAHGGTISVMSEESEGTAFNICLPVHLLEEVEAMHNQGLVNGTSLTSPPNMISRINIEFSDIYSLYDDDISQIKKQAL